MNFKLYFYAWLFFCFLGLIVSFIKRERILFFDKKYWKFLLKKWKIATFLIATSVLIFISPYMNDPTWDYFDMAIMAILTFLTAPWTIGVFYNLFKNRIFKIEILLAIILWLFSASWSYDLYILLRDGYYPETWIFNFYASSILYFLAGLFWNIEWNKKDKLILSFTKNNWLEFRKTSFKKIIPLLFLFGGIVLCLLIYGSFYS